MKKLSRDYMIDQIEKQLKELTPKLTRQQMEQEYVNTMMMGMKNLNDASLKKQFNRFFELSSGKQEVWH